MQTPCGGTISLLHDYYYNSGRLFVCRVSLSLLLIFFIYFLLNGPPIRQPAVVCAIVAVFAPLRPRASPTVFRHEYYTEIKSNKREHDRQTPSDNGIRRTSSRRRRRRWVRTKDSVNDENIQ